MVWIFAHFRRKKLGPLQESVLRLLVMPNDLDIYGHMNNGRYLTLMDLGRIDFIIRTGLGKIGFQNKWKPLVASVNIQYKRSLRLFELFELHTRILCWDEKWIIIEQRFEQNGHVFAFALVKGLFKSPAGNIPPSEMLSAIGESTASPPPPQAVVHWLESEKLFKEKY